MRLECRALRFDTPLDARDLDLWEGALRGFCFRTMLARSGRCSFSLTQQPGGGRPWLGGWGWLPALPGDTDEINQDIDDLTLIFLPAHVVVFFPSSPILKRPATSTFQDVQYV
jgi:hypothetical protein